MSSPPLSKNQPEKPSLCVGNADPFLRARWGVGAGRAKQPPFFLVRDPGGPVAFGLHTSVSNCGGCERVRCPGEEYAFKMKVGILFYGNIRFGESVGLPLTPGGLVSIQAWTCPPVLVCRLSQQLRALQISPVPVPCSDLLFKAPGLPAESGPMTLGSDFYLP